MAGAAGRAQGCARAGGLRHPRRDPMPPPPSTGLLAPPAPAPRRAPAGPGRARSPSRHRCERLRPAPGSARRQTGTDPAPLGTAGPGRSERPRTGPAPASPRGKVSWKTGPGTGCPGPAGISCAVKGGRTEQETGEKQTKENTNKKYQKAGVQ